MQLVLDQSVLCQDVVGVNAAYRGYAITGRLIWSVACYRYDGHDPGALWKTKSSSNPVPHLRPGMDRDLVGNRVEFMEGRHYLLHVRLIRFNSSIEELGHLLKAVVSITHGPCPPFIIRSSNEIRQGSEESSCSAK
ncbi:MAG: hypothetical protein ACOX38_09780 [Bacillota bacterium]